MGAQPRDARPRSRQLGCHCFEGRNFTDRHCHDEIGRKSSWARRAAQAGVSPTPETRNTRSRWPAMTRLINSACLSHFVAKEVQQRQARIQLHRNLMSASDDAIENNGSAQTFCRALDHYVMRLLAR